MATGLELLMTAICMNVSVCDADLNPVMVPSATTSLEVVYPYPTSLQEKADYLKQLRDDLYGKELTIAVIEDFPLSYMSNETGTLTPMGVAFQLLEFLTDKFNFTFKVIHPKRDVVGSSWDLEGSLIELVNTSADLAVGFIPDMFDARTYVDFSTTTLDEGNWIMMMRRPGESATGSGLMAPFDRDVWLLILLSLTTVGPSVYGLVILRMKLTKDKEQGIYKLPHCMWFVYGALMKQGSTLTPIADSTRMLFATWWIFITILTSFYTANLTAFLTLSRFTLPINSREDILNNNHRFVAYRGSGVEYSIKNTNETLAFLMPMVNRNRVAFVDAQNDTNTLNTFVKGDNYVFIKDRPGIDYLIYHDYQYRKTIGSTEREHCPFAIAKKPFMLKKRSFVYNKNFKYGPLFDPELLNLVETGIVKYMLLENLPNAEVCPQNLGSQERQLRNGDLWMTYQIMMGGFGTGFIIFITEIIFKLLINCWQRRRGRVFDNGQESFKSMTPPPSYATLYNQSRRNNIWTTHNMPNKDADASSSGGVEKYINGRQYRVMRGANGEERLIPIRTPSAALFQYAYTN